MRTEGTELEFVMDHADLSLDSQEDPETRVWTQVLYWPSQETPGGKWILPGTKGMKAAFPSMFPLWPNGAQPRWEILRDTVVYKIYLRVIHKRAEVAGV